MEQIHTSTIPEKIPTGRRNAAWRALLRTIKGTLSFQNPLRQFVDTFRYNQIKWSAANLRKPSLGKRIGLFFGTRNPLMIIADNFRLNKSEAVRQWELATIRDINLVLTNIGDTPLKEKKKGTFNILKKIRGKIDSLHGYKDCPDMRHERYLLDTYRHILAAPYDKKFENLCPDDLCAFLEQSDIKPSDMYYQNYECILQGKQTALYQTATTMDGSRYLKQADTVMLEKQPGGGYQLSLYDKRLNPESRAQVAALLEPSSRQEKVLPLTTRKSIKNRKKSSKGKGIKL